MHSFCMLYVLSGVVGAYGICFLHLSRIRFVNENRYGNCFAYVIRLKRFDAFA